MVDLPYVGRGNDTTRATPVVNVDSSGFENSGPQSYPLYIKGVSTPTPSMRGGDYSVTFYSSVAWPNGSTATLEERTPDDLSWQPMRNQANTANVTMTANGKVNIGVSHLGRLRINFGATAVPTDFYATAGGLA